MILFYNVFITDKFWGIYDRGRFGPVRDRLNVFKYSLASCAVFPWEHVVIYCQLDENYQHRKQELHDFINANFQNAKIYDRRLDQQKDWQVALNEILALPGDDLVWFACNDDHIFIDYELDLFNRCKAKVQELSKTHQYVSMYFTAWAESIAYRIPGYLGKWEEKSFEVLEINQDYFVNIWTHDDSIQLVNKKLLHDWWFKLDYGDAFLPRTDTPVFKGNFYQAQIACVHPLRELCRHYDGSSHVKIDLNAFAPLRIPPGFFENDIKILYCSDKPKDGYVNINPTNQKLAVVDPDGTEARWVLDDIPLFWKNRISKIEVARKIDQTTLLSNRNESVIKAASQFGGLQRDQIINDIKVALRADQTGQIQLLPNAESLEKVDYHSVYRKKLSSPRISVILLERYNNYTYEQSIRSLQHQTLDRSEYEIIWIATQDDIMREVFSITDTLIHSNQHKYWKEQTYHKQVAYNAGIIEAQSDIIIFADTNAIFSSLALEKVYKTFSENKANLFLTFQENFIQTTHEDNRNKKTIGAIAVRRKDIIEICGFDEDRRFIGHNGSLLDVIKRLREKGLQETKVSEEASILRVTDPKDLTIDELQKFCGNSLYPVKANFEIARLAGKNVRTQENPDVAFFQEANKRLLSENLLSTLEWTKTCKNVSGTSPGLETLIITFELLNYGDLDKATLALNNYATQVEHKSEILNTLGILKYASGKTEDACNLMLQALNADPANLNTRTLLVEVFKLNNQPKELAALCYDSLRYYPGSKMFSDQLTQCITILQGAQSL